jgi:hypothetical protein
MFFGNCSFRASLYGENAAGNQHLCDPRLRFEQGSNPRVVL